MKAIFAIATLVCLLSSNARAVPTSIAVQGRITDSLGSPYSARDENMSFEIFDAQIDGTSLWAEDQAVAIKTGGLWSASLGLVTALADEVFRDSVRWLQIILEDGTVLPRIRLETDPYAHRVSTVDGASGGTITSDVGIRESAPTSVLHVGGPIATAIRSATTATTLGPDDSILLVTAGFTVTLPDAATCRGRQYMIKKTVGGADVVVQVTPDSGDTIDDEDQRILEVQYQSITVVSDGVDKWVIID